VSGGWTLDEIAAARGRVSNLWLGLATDEAFLRASFGLYRAAMHAEGGLPCRDRELLCLATSVANGCAYCRAHHRRHLLEAGLAPEQVVAMEAGRELGDPRADALIALARALAQDPACPMKPLRARLSGLGLGALEVQQAIQVCATYALFNRLALALGVELEPEFLP
jgi:uncharacterized peroxidase-related enzyme